jgi:hypothetical protein
MRSLSEYGPQQILATQTRSYDPQDILNKIKYAKDHAESCVIDFRGEDGHIYRLPVVGAVVDRLEQGSVVTV